MVDRARVSSDKGLFIVTARQWAERRTGVVPVFAALMASVVMTVGPHAQGSLDRPGGRAVSASDGNLGFAVAIAGPVAVAGAPSARNFAGAVHIYAHTRQGWRQQAVIDDPGKHANDFFGDAVAASGTTVIVGTAGQVAYVFVRSGSNWRLQARLKSPNLGSCDLSAAVSGETVMIGAPCGDGGSGAAYIYVRSGTKWHLRQTLDNPSNSLSQVGFGSAVALAGSVAVVGNGDANDAYIFVSSGSSWPRRARLTEPHAKANDFFGDAVAISGRNVLIGAFGANNGKGALYAYAPAGRSWSRRGSFKSPATVPQANFGSSVSISGRNALIGAPEENFRSCGTAYEFTLSGSTWRERARLINPHCAANDWFGQAVAISGNEALIGSGHGRGIVYYTNVP